MRSAKYKDENGVIKIQGYKWVITTQGFKSSKLKNNNEVNKIYA